MVAKQFKQALIKLDAYNQFKICFYSPANHWRGNRAIDEYISRKIELKTVSFNNILFDAFDFSKFDLEYWTRISEKLRDLQSRK